MTLEYKPSADPLGDGKSRIQLIDKMGEDISIVNDARASFEQESMELTDKDKKLIKYLINHEHTCYDRETEVLARINGQIQFISWQALSELRELDKPPQIELAAYNPRGGYYGTSTEETNFIDTILWEEPTNWTQLNYEGDIYHLENEHLDLTITPEHQVYIAHGQDDRLVDAGVPIHQFKLQPVKEINNPVFYQRSCLYDGQNDHTLVNSTNELQLFNLGYLIGLMVGDGYLNKDDQEMQFATTEEVINRIKILCANLNIPLEYTAGNFIAIKIAEISKHFNTFPILIKPQLQRSEKMILADACFHAPLKLRRGISHGLLNSTCGMVKKNFSYIITINDHLPLAEQIQILSIFNEDPLSLEHKKLNSLPQYNYILRSQPEREPLHQPHEQQKVYFKDTVYCATVSTGILIVRRHNKIVFSGNSPFRGVVFKFKVKCPLFLARQWWKHTVASSHVDEQMQWNEKCIARDQKITTCSGAVYTMEELAQQWENNPTHQNIKLWSLTREGAIVENKIKDIWSNGTRDIYRITCADKQAVDTTLNHRFLTLMGYKPLEQIKVGDQIAIVNKMIKDAKKFHSQEFKDKYTYFTTFDRVTSIKYLRQDETYDLQMEGDNNFVLNQFVVHNSFRYVSIDDANDFYIPQTFRKQAKNNKQATEGSLESDVNQKAIAIYQQQCEASYQAYQALLQLGVGREQARGVLVPSVYTSWTWTVSLQALLHFLFLRKGAGAQSEIGAYAKEIEEMIRPHVPIALEHWLNRKEESHG